MKRTIFILSGLLVAALAGCNSPEENMAQVVDRGLSVAGAQYRLMAEELIDDKDSLPRTTDGHGNLVKADTRWWTCGFFPGTLWYLYEATGDQTFKSYAQVYTARVEREQYTTTHHDVGFMIYCSFGNGLRLTGNEAYKKVILQGAESLSTRYNDTVGLICSWDGHRDKWQYPVIIDNMMNLELLEWASKNSDSTKYAYIAKKHANNTMAHQYRPDYSCYHVVSYDTLTGEPEKKQTAQGYADESQWARGQAWGLYGYTMMFRETGDSTYLRQAEDIARYLIHHPDMPADMVPYWDFDAPDKPGALRDASAAAIMASALLELSRYTQGEFSKECVRVAETQLRTLSSPEYLAEPGTNAYFILKHSVGALPKKSEVDVPLTYADYYYVEALVRYKEYFLK